MQPGFSFGHVMPDDRQLSIFVIAGEASGDQLGAHLIDGLKTLRRDLKFDGIGGEMMAARGFESMFDMSELSVMGVAEVLPRLRSLLRRISEVADKIIADPPDVLLTIDSPDFCLRVARKVKARIPDLKVVHYVAPSVWAWRPKRANKMARCVDHVLALLPFEPPYMEAAGMTCDFVGHPVATVPQISHEDGSAFRDRYLIAHAAPLLCVLPGSRTGEVQRHSAVFRDVIAHLQTKHPNLETLIPMAPAVTDLVRSQFGDMEKPPKFLEPDADPIQKFTAFAASDAALAVSGTVSLELAAQSTPMVIAYDASPITKFIMKRAFLLDTATLVNIVTETKAVPEFIFDRFQSELIAPAVDQLLMEQDEDQVSAARSAMDRLGRGGDDPGLRAARSLLGVIE